MKKLRSLILMGGLLGITAVFLSCDFSSGGDVGFNTSRAHLEVNFSGQYLGVLEDGKAVSMTSGGPITSFMIQQAGNTIEVIDSNGQKYRGVLGAPGALLNPESSTVLPVGAQLAVFQASWEGKDGVAAKDVKFTGVIDVVTVDRVEGDSTDQSIDTETSLEESEEREGPVLIEDGGGLTNIFDVSTSESSSSSTSTSTSREITTTFELSENNSQLRLRGTWIEEGGLVAQVGAASPGNGFFMGRAIVERGGNSGNCGGGSGSGDSGFGSGSNSGSGSSGSTGGNSSSSGGSSRGGGSSR